MFTLSSKIPRKTAPKKRSAKLPQNLMIYLGPQNIGKKTIYLLAGKDIKNYIIFVGEKA